MVSDLKRRSIKALLWSGAESFGLVGLSFLTFLVMARTLDPSDFGIAALAGVFIFFSNVLANQGLGEAIVQRLQLDAMHLHATFWTSVTIAVTLMTGVLVGADWIAALLGEPEVAPVLRWLAVGLPINALSTVQMALLRRDLRFRALAMRSIGGRIGGAVVGVSMALTGWGVWSLVGQQLVGTVLTALALIVLSDWRPRLRFSSSHLRDLFAFGFHVSAAQVVIAMGEQAMTLLIGTLLGSVALGYYTIAWRMVDLIRALISSAVYQVGFSAFSRLQADLVAMRRAFTASTSISCLFGFPIAVGLMILGGPAVEALFGNKWAPSMPLLSILAIDLIVVFYGMFFAALFRSRGRPEWMLWIALANLAYGLVAVTLAAPHGIAAVAAVLVSRGLLLLPVHLLLSSRLLEVPVTGLVRLAMPPAVAVLGMTAVVLPIRWQFQDDLSPAALLLLAVPLGAAVYLSILQGFFPKLVRESLHLIGVRKDPAAVDPEPR